MGVFNIIWGSVALVVILSMYFNCRYIVKGNKNIIIGVTIPFLFYGYLDCIFILGNYLLNIIKS